jgi:hypothetical protein
MDKAGGEMRVDKRDAVVLPVRTEVGETGCTRDLSASGAYLEIGGKQSVGDEIRLTIQVNLEKQQVLLSCRGVVVRVEEKGERFGVAVKFIESDISAVN